MDGIIEIRGYQLKPGTAQRFDAVMREESLPLLRQAGTVVLVARPSLHSPESYLLVRAYRDTAHRLASQEAFYGSAAWLEGPYAAIMECIASYTTVVVETGVLATLDTFTSGERHATQ